jgi:hypothetical protein
MYRRIQRIVIAGLLGLTLAFGYSYRDSVNLWPVLFDQLASDPSGGGSGGGGG